jgi:hypothetical protein
VSTVLLSIQPSSRKLEENNNEVLYVLIISAFMAHTLKYLAATLGNMEMESYFCAPEPQLVGQAAFKFNNE